MTTFVFEGVQVNYDNDDGTFIGPAELRIVVNSANATFSYSILEPNPGDLPTVDFDGNVQMVAVNYQNLDALENQFGSEVVTDIGNVTFSGGGGSTILGLSFSTGPDSDTDVIFVLDGTPLPSIGSQAEWDSLENSVIGAGNATGSFAPGQTISWADLAYTQLTEDDEFVGTNGRDTFNGGKGDDYFTSSAGRDTYNGGKGTFDQVNYSRDPGAVTVNLANGTARDGFGNRDELNGIEVVRGSLFDDTLIGNGGSNVFRGLAGADDIDGARGFDQVRYDRDARFDGGDNGVTVNLNKGFAIDGFGDRDTLTSIENARGSDFNDKLIGSKGKNDLRGLVGNDKINGLGGADSLQGEDGRDTLNGGGGNDFLSGGRGSDIFIFTGNFGNDTIMDFSTNGTREQIDLSGVNSIKNFRDLKNNHLSNQDGSAFIDDNNGNTIALEGFRQGALSADDFLF